MIEKRRKRLLAFWARVWDVSIPTGQGFQVLPLRLRFRASEEVFFPAGQPGNIVRGGFGAALRKLAWVPERTPPHGRERRAESPYACIFEPRRQGSGPSGLADPPRPFVFRTHHLDGCAVEAGEHFHIDLHLFDVRAPLFGFYVESLRLLASEGLGPRRGRAALEAVDLLDGDGRPRCTAAATASGPETVSGPPLELSLSPDPVPVSRLLVRFLTPTELKGSGVAMERPPFSVLMARVRDRISALRALYGPGPLTVDFRALGQRARRVTLVRAGMRQVQRVRRSAGSGAMHPIGGFIGEAEYEGELAEFAPFLRAAYWTGVGRHTVWGNGAILPVVVSPQGQAGTVALPGVGLGL